ncbi:hypothetical protein D9M68_378890 [compost metagenome]
MATQQQGRAFGQGGLDLAIEFVAQVEAGHGSDEGGVSLGIADLQRLDRRHEALGEGFGDGGFEDDALGGDAHLAGVVEATGDRSLHGLVQIGVGQHDERVGTAQLQHALLQCRTGLGRDGCTGADATGHRHHGDTRVGDGHGNQRRLDVDHLEHAFRQAGFSPDGGQQAGAAHHVGGVLEHIAVAAEDDRHRAAHDLPHREVPGHHGQHRAQRQVGNHGLVVLHQGRLVRDHGRAVLGVPLTEPGAFLDLATGLADRHAHLGGGHPRHGFGVGAQGTGHAHQRSAALLDAELAPRRETTLAGRQAGFEGSGILVGIAGNFFAGGGVTGDGGWRSHAVLVVRESRSGLAISLAAKLRQRPIHVKRIIQKKVFTKRE